MNPKVSMALTSTRIIQLSDIHLFSHADQKLAGVNTQESFTEIVDLLKQDQFELIILSGDISQDGSADSYLRLADTLSEFDVPIYWVPGNHDDSNILQTTFPYKNVSGLKQVKFDHWQLILLDSHVPFAVEGFLVASEINFLEKCLQQYPDKQALIVFHHPPMKTGSEWLDKIGLLNAEIFWETLARYPQANTVLFGHVHHEYSGEVNGIKYFSAPSTCVQFKKNVVTFQLENIPPGYRWLELFSNGVVESGVTRLDKYVGTFSDAVGGY